MKTNKKRGLLSLSLTLSLLAVGVSSSVSAQHAPSSRLPTQSPAQYDVAAPVEPLPVMATNPVQAAPQTLSLQSAAVVACDTAGYGTKTGQALVDHILNQPSNCINDLYTANATSFAAFQPANMAAVANATAAIASGYSASNGPNNINNLYYFLRTGYYISYYNPGDVGTYGSSVKNAVRAALDNLVNNADFYSNSDQHGKNIQDAIILMDSAEENARYLPMIKQWLTRWNSSYATSWDMRSAVNGIFTVLFRGHQSTDFQALVKNDTQLAQLLGNFARQDWMLSTDALYLQENAAGELGRLLQYTSAPVYSTVKSEVQAVLNRYSMNGTGKSVWLRLAGQVDYYNQCAAFNICGFKADLEAQVLSINHTCSSTLKMRVEEMNSAQLDFSCGELSAQESYFHQQLMTSYTPVADDNNTGLELVVFNNSSSYQANAGILFGIDTNNGGMYLEGNPSDPSNQARFLAYEAEWLLPEFHVWNLTHEYVHYLDGRFNLKGDFGDARTGTHKTVWWIEGLAEYISKKNFNDSAIALARTKQFTLTQVFTNDYSSGQDRVYRWGYLAVRFMFEKHPSEVTQMLQYFRAGNYDGYLSYINSLSGLYDSEWNTWLGVVDSSDTPPPVDDGVLVNGQSVAIASPADGSDLEFYIDVPNGASNLRFATAGGSGDADLYVKRDSKPTASSYDCRPYIGGNTETCNFASPSAGRWYVVIKPYSPYSGASLVASYTETGTPTNQPPVVNINGPYAGVAGAAIAFSSSGSSDADGSIATYAWNFGDNSSSSAANPNHVYASFGSYIATLTVTDNMGASSSINTTVEVSSSNSLPDSCATQQATDYVDLQSDVPLCVTSANNGTLYFYFYVDGVSQIDISTGHGSGNADLYYSSTGWPTLSSYSKVSNNSGNVESVTSYNPTVGWHYVMISGTHSGLTLKMTAQ